MLGSRNYDLALLFLQHTGSLLEPYVGSEAKRKRVSEWELASEVGGCSVSPVRISLPYSCR